MPKHGQGSAPFATVLVVEDEFAIRISVATYLRDCGYRVFEAVSADEALIVLQDPDFTVDIVFSDLEMPGSIDGFGLKRWAAQSRPDVRVILAGTPKRAAEKAGGLCDEGPLLSKPYEPQIVEDRIRRLLALRATSANTSVPRSL